MTHNVVFILMISAFAIQMTLPAQGSVPRPQITAEMERILTPLHSPGGWKSFISSHPALFGEVSDKKPESYLAVEDVTVTIDGEKYDIGMGARSVWIAASPKTVVEVVNNPHHFTALYGLDKPADIYPVQPDGSYDAHIFKLVPGIETQDYTLNYSGKWDGDVWIQQAKLVKDERSFALRNNMKIVEASGKGSIFREVALLYPERWWMRLLNGIVRSIFKSELGKLNRSLRCASEKVQNGIAMSDNLAQACYKEAQK